jgi:hypothetical protein
MTLLFILLTAQALLGAFDNIWHHEITERLPSKRSASGELTLHAARELIYAAILLQLGWLELHGAWTVLLAAALIIEVIITMADFLLEDRTRRLPPFERILHTILAINFGMILITFAPILSHWWNRAFPRSSSGQHWERCRSYWWTDREWSLRERSPQVSHSNFRTWVEHSNTCSDTPRPPTAPTKLRPISTTTANARYAAPR